MTVRYRDLALADLDAILAIEEDAFSSPWTRGMFAAEVSGPDRRWFVAEDDAGLVGYAGGWVIAGDAHLLNLAVAPSARRSGIGRESGQESIFEFLQTKSVWIETEESTANPFIIR